MRIAFKTKVQIALFKNELIGQISDGMWENCSGRPQSDLDSIFRAAIVQADGDIVKLGRDFPLKKGSYRFSSRALIDVVGDRMIAIAKAAGAPDSYGYNDLVDDLVEIYHAFRTVVSR